MTRLIKTTFTLAALMLVCLAPGAFAAFPTVGNPNDTSPTNGATLAAAIQAAYSSGAAGVTINPGTYTLNQPNTADTFQDPNLKLDGISHSFEIDAYNVKFVMLGNHSGIDLDYDTGLVIKGLTIGYASPYGNQGVIQALGYDSNGKGYLDVQNDAGYPTSTTNYGYCTVLVGSSHVPRAACPDLVNFAGNTTDLGNNEVRVHFTNIGDWTAAGVQTGDYLVSVAGGAPMMRFIFCNNCTLQDATLLSSPCEATISDSLDTGDHFLHDTITYGPPPSGATVSPMRSVESGIQASDDSIGPDVENCYFEGLGDDNNDLRGDYPQVTAVNGNTVTMTYNQFLWQGVTQTQTQPIRLSNQAGEYLDTTVTQQQVITNPDKSQSSVLTLAQAPPSDFVNTTASASNPNLNCPGYKFISNTFRDSRGHGIVARGDNGLIQGNTLANLKLDGVFLGVGSGAFSEGDYVHNVTVQNNVFTNNPGLIVSNNGAQGNANITITGNVFANTTGLFYGYSFVPNTSDNPSIAALGVTGLTIAHNTFADLGQQTTIGGAHPNSVHAVNIQNSSQITLATNLLTNPGANTASPVYAVDSTSQQSITGMNAASFPVGLFSQEYITLTNAAAGLNLDDPNYNTKAGTLLQLYPSDGVSAQNWQVNWQTDGSCTLTNQASNGLVLDDFGGGGVGTYQGLWTPNGGANQEWWFVPSGSSASTYTLKSVYAGINLEDPNASTTSGTQVWLNAISGSAAQNWQVKPAPAPAVPTSLTATASSAQVVLSWTGSAGATSYNVYRNTSSGTETLLKSGLTATSYTDTGLTNGVTCFYQVAAVNNFGTSARSAEASATPQAVPVSQIDAGGGAAGTFIADTDASGGSTYATSAAISTSGVTSPAPQAVYQTQRYGNFTYAVPGLTPGGSYTLRLHFAEVYWTAAGMRVFNVAVNSTTVLSNFDIFAAAGGANKAVVKTFPVTADSSGKVTIVFTAVKDNASLNGLELLH